MEIYLAGSKKEVSLQSSFMQTKAGQRWSNKTCKNALSRMIKRITYCLIIIFFSLPAFGKEKGSGASVAITAEEKRKFDYFFLEALRQKMLGNRDAAADNLFRCHSIDPENATVFSELANLNISIGRVPLAKKYMIEAVKSDPENFWMKQALAQLYTQNREYKLAAEVCKEIIKHNPEKKEYSYMLASLYSQMQQYQEAIKVFNRIEDETGVSDQISLEKFKLYLSLNNPKKAFAEIDKLIETFPREIKYKILKGDLYLAVDNNKEAYKCYRSVLKEFPDDPLANNKLGFFYIQQTKQIKEGIDYIRKALEINPNYEESWSMLINYYSIKSDTAGMMNATREAIEHFPENAEFYLAMGAAARAKKDSDTALWAWKKAVSLTKGQNSALSSVIQGQIGDLYMEMKRKQEAYLAYDTAIIYNENNILVLNNYAYFLALDGIELQKAERMSGKTIKAEPKSPVFLDTYAWVYFKQGYYMPALLYIEQAYFYGGDKDAEVLEHYGDILYKTGDEQKARKMWEAAWEIKKGDEMDNLILKKKIESGIYVEN